jgi:hypothetical protein
MKVSNMQSRKGNDVPNQFIISDNSKGTFFQSYNSIIAGKTPQGIILDEYYWNYSRTTLKYLSLFLDSSTMETKKRIKDGTYTLANLNP